MSLKDKKLHELAGRASRHSKADCRAPGRAPWGAGSRAPGHQGFDRFLDGDEHDVRRKNLVGGTTMIVLKSTVALSAIELGFSTCWMSVARTTRPTPTPRK